MSRAMRGSSVTSAGRRNWLRVGAGRVVVAGVAVAVQIDGADASRVRLAGLGRQDAAQRPVRATSAPANLRTRPPARLCCTPVLTTKRCRWSLLPTVRSTSKFAGFDAYFTSSPALPGTTAVASGTVSVDLAEGVSRAELQAIRVAAVHLERDAVVTRFGGRLEGNHPLEIGEGPVRRRRTDTRTTRWCRQPRTSATPSDPMFRSIDLGRSRAVHEKVGDRGGRPGHELPLERDAAPASNASSRNPCRYRKSSAATRYPSSESDRISADRLARYLP